MNNLSHTQFSKFQDCPTAWRYHYKEGYRPIKQSSALLFGSAIDKALEAVLKNPEVDLYSVFDKMWNFQEINKKLTALPTCLDIQYSKSDYDEELLFDEDKQKFSGYDISLLLEKENLTKEEDEVLHLASWLSLKRKGEAMLHTFQSEVMSKINKVYAVQKQIKLTNNTGDVITGYIDLVADYADEGVVVFDVKTASREYDKGAVLTSPQLSLYVHGVSEEYNTRKAGYIVLIKKLMKDKTKVCSKCGFNGTGGRHKTCNDESNGERCNGEWIEKINPRCLKQILVDNIPEQTEDIVLQNMDYINQAIKNGVYYRNLQSCIRPYGKCQFFNLCYYNDDKDLIKI